ncbi:DUF1833 family protein [Halomonas sp. 5021]|uniref:DUF1833 family protein n=1 Tax=Halomonas sp. 5021 TaxID=3082156 RepID=UPI002FC8427E
MSLRESAFAEATGDVWLPLLTISHPDINPSIRVVFNTQAIVSRGDEFLPFPFDVKLPNETDDAPSRARLIIDNVSREIAQAVRSIRTSPSVMIEIIRADAPDTVEMSWPNFWLRNVSWNAQQVSGELVLEDLTDEPYPAGTFTPASFPALF